MLWDSGSPPQSLPDSLHTQTHGQTLVWGSQVSFKHLVFYYGNTLIFINDFLVLKENQSLLDCNCKTLKFKKKIMLQDISSTCSFFIIF